MLLTCNEIQAIKEETFEWANKPEDIDVLIIHVDDEGIHTKVSYRDKVKYHTLSHNY